MSTERNLQTLQNLVRGVNDGDIELVAQQFAPGFEDHNPGWAVKDMAEFLTFIRNAHNDFQIRNTVLDTIVSGDKIVVRIQNESTHNKESFGVAATHRHTSIEIIEIYRFVEGKIAERWVQSDMLGLLGQIGARFPFADAASRDDLGAQNVQVVGRIMNAVNDHDYDVLDTIMAEDFTDHHPGAGAGIASREDYRNALKYMHASLGMRAELDFSFAHEDKVITRVYLSGKHTGDFMGIAPTGNEVRWTTMEIYRLENGLIKERWAEDDMAGLATQLGVTIFP